MGKYSFRDEITKFIDKIKGLNDTLPMLMFIMIKSRELKNNEFRSLIDQKIVEVIEETEENITYNVDPSYYSNSVALHELINLNVKFQIARYPEKIFKKRPISLIIPVKTIKNPYN